MDDDCRTLLDVISDSDALDSFLNVDGLDVCMPSHSQHTTRVPTRKNRLSHAFVASYVEGGLSEQQQIKLNSITKSQHAMFKGENASGFITATFDPGGQQTDKQQGQEPAEAMNDQSLMLSMQEQNTVNMDIQSKDTLDIFGDDDLFSDTMETNSNQFESLLSQAAAVAGVFPFMDEVDETMDSITNQPVETQPVVTNQLVIPSAQPVVSLPQPTSSLPQKMNTMPMFNQTLQPMISNQPGQPTTAVLQVTPSGQQIIQQIPANAQGGQQILVQGLMTQLAPVKTSQGIIGTVQLQQGLQGQQQPLTSFVLNTGGTRFPIQTAVSQMQLSKLVGKSGPVAISPKPSSKGPRHISPKPQPGQRVIQILPNQAVTRTLQIAPRAPRQQQTFLIRNPNVPGNLQLFQGINTGQTVIANSGVVRAPNYQLIQGGNPAATMISGRITTQGSTTTSSTQSKSNSNRGRQTKNNALSNTQTTQSKSVAPLSSASLSSTALTNQTQANFASNALNSVYNFSQPMNSQPTIVTVTENKTSNPVITIGASGSMIVVKQSKPIMVTASNPGLGTQTVVTSIANQKLMMDSILPQPLSQSTVFSNQQPGHFVLPPASGNGQMKVMQSQSDASLGAADIALSDYKMQFNQSMQVPSPQQLPGKNLTKQTNIPAFANQILSQSFPQTVQNNTVTTSVNAASNAAHNQYTALQQSLGQHNTQTSIGQSGLEVVLNQIPSQQVSTPNMSLTHRQLQGPSDQHITTSSYSVGLPQQQTTSSQALQGVPLVVQNQAGTSQNQSDQQQKTRELQIILQHNPSILKDLMLKNPAVFQNSFKNNPQMQHKLQMMLQQMQHHQQNTGPVNTQNLAGNTNIHSTSQQPQQITPDGSLSLVHNQSSAPSQASIQANLPNVQTQLVNQSNTLLNSSSGTNLGSNIQPISIARQPQPVISAQAAAIMKYPPNRSNNAKKASASSVGMLSSTNSGSSQKGLQASQSGGGAMTPSAAISTSTANQTLNLPATFQISIKAQEQLQTIQNHIRTLTGIPSLTEQQTRLLQQLQLIQQKIVTQARLQMLAQQTRQSNAMNIQPQPTQNTVSKSNKKTSKNVLITPKQNNSNAPTVKDSVEVKQEPTNTGGAKTSALTPYQQQIVRTFQEKLKNMTREEQQAYIKSQQSLLLTLQQQKQAKQDQISTGSQPIKVESKGTKRPAQYQLTRSSLMLHQIKQNQETMVAPDLKTPFKSYKDAVHRLLNYHVSTDRTPTSQQLQEVDDAFEEVSIRVLEKKQRMYSKYQQLIMQDSMKTSESSEMVMLGRMILQDEKAHIEEEKQLPHDELIAKLRSLPEYKDLKPELIHIDDKSDLVSPAEINPSKSETQDVKMCTKQDICSTELETNSANVQEITNPHVEALEATPSIEIVSPPLDHRTKDEGAETLLELSPKDCNGFITRELPVDNDGRQKTLKLKFRLRRPSTLQDLLEDQGGSGDRDSELDESKPPTPTFDCSLNGPALQHSSTYDVFEMPDIDNEDISIVNDANQQLSLVETQDENTRDESIGSELKDIEDDEGDEVEEDQFEDEGGIDSTGALSVQNQSAINHILSFRSHENVEIPSLQNERSDIYQSVGGGVVNGLEFEFDDDEEEAMQDFAETEKAINKLDQDLENLNKANRGYSYSMSNMQDPDLEEAVNSILF